MGYYKSCNKSDINVSPEISTFIDNTKPAEYVGQENENRIILAQALMKIFNENRNLVDLTIEECNKFFDGDRDVLCTDLFEKKITEQVKFEGKLVNSLNSQFGEIINNFANETIFKNIEGKAIHNNNKFNFTNEILKFDPLIQLYFYKGTEPKSTEIQGIVITPKTYNEKEVSEFKIIKKDGSFATISSIKDPKDNYLVISTNERIPPNKLVEYKKGNYKFSKKTNVIDDRYGDHPAPENPFDDNGNPILGGGNPGNGGSGPTYSYSQDRFTYKITAVNGVEVEQPYTPPGLRTVIIDKARFETMDCIRLYEGWIRGEPEVRVEEIKYFNINNPNDPLLVASAIREPALGLGGDFYEGCGFLNLSNCVRTNENDLQLSSWSLGSEADYRWLFFYEEDGTWEGRDQPCKNFETLVNNIIKYSFKTDQFKSNGLIKDVINDVNFVQIADCIVSNIAGGTLHDMIGYALIPINFKRGELFRVYDRRTAAISYSDIIRKESNQYTNNYTLTSDERNYFNNVANHRKSLGGDNKRFSGLFIWLKD